MVATIEKGGDPFKRWTIRDKFDELSKGSLADIIDTYKALVSEDYILAEWYAVVRNWGDSLNPVLIEHLSKKKPILFRNFLNVYDRLVYMVVGSLLQTPRAKNVQVWGTGLISDSERMVARPKHIFAVRGPRTREILLKQDIPCPKVFGDPALLFPSIYKPDVVKEYRLGIVPHYMDASSPLLSEYRDVEGVKIIDVAGDVHGFVRDVCSCRAIASSSLHGCIAADAYHVPSLWIKITGNIRGKDFKFYDYYESIGIEDATPFSLVSAKDADELVDECQIKEIDLDLEELRNACPFLAE